MGRCLFPLFLAFILVSRLCAQVMWEDISAVYDRAKAKNKSVMVFFLDLNYCSECASVKEKVINSPDFKKKTQENYELLVLSYLPSFEANSHGIDGVSMTDRYGIVSHLTVVFTDSERRPYDALESNLSLDIVLEKLKTSAEKRKLFETYVKDLPTLSGNSRYELMDKLFNLMPEWLYVAYYKDYIDEALREDFLDKSRQKYRIRKHDEEEMLNDYVGSMVDKIHNSPEEAIDEIMDYLRKRDLLPESRQILIAQIGYTLSFLGDVKKTTEYLEKAVNTKANGENVEYFNALKKSVIENSHIINKKQEQDSSNNSSSRPK